MALAALSGDEQRILFSQLCNVLDPGVAVALSSVSNELRAATLALLKATATPGSSTLHSFSKMTHCSSPQRGQRHRDARAARGGGKGANNGHTRRRRRTAV